MNNNTIAVDSENAPVPCSGCEHYTDCAVNLKACHLYYKYVSGQSGKPRPVRAKAIYQAIDSDDGDRDVRAFLDTVRAARHSLYTAVFYRSDTRRFTSAQNDNRRYSELCNDDSAVLIGFYGPDLTEQQIADSIEVELEKWQQ